MANSVVNIADYRPQKSSAPCVVTFIGFTFDLPEGGKLRLTRSFEIENGDFEGAIEAVKERGGIYVPSQDGGATVWFLPWPCAAVRISTVEK
jgi:hypothetical protein